MTKVARKPGAARRQPPPSSSAVRTPAASTQVALFIAKFEPQMATLIRSCRKELRRQLPTAIELVYDNYNFFVIGYSSTERPSDCIVSLAAAANGVGLSFYYGARLKDPAGLLQGTGKQNRFIRLPAESVLRRAAVKSLIKAASDNGKSKLPPSGGGYTIIKSISAKQRPRRRETRAA